MKIIAKALGGSHAYGLNTPESDTDIRYVFLNTEIDKIIGLARHEHESTNLDGSDDCFGFELRRFLSLLKKGNTQCLELLFETNWIEKTEEFDLIREHKWSLIDSSKIFTCLLGYAHGEKSQILGHSTAKLGQKRKKAIEKYGYSYKNAIHAIRLLSTGIMFFEKDVYPVNFAVDNPEVFAILRSIQANPESYRPGDLIASIDALMVKLEEAYKNRRSHYTFSDEIANKIVLLIYGPLVGRSLLEEISKGNLT